MLSNQAIGHRFESKLRTNDVKPSENVTFDELLLSENILSGLKKSGFQSPSPIQLKAIPLGRCGIDLVVQAKSGTGKTCVFSVISLEAIATNTTSLQCIILAPTREIALQIQGVLRAIGRDIPHLHVQSFIGGTLVSEDRLKSKKCHIAVGSPGRMKQLIELGELDVKNVRLFVLDEADKLMEEGCFQTQINWIYSTLPTNKQMIALSATYPDVLAQFLTRYMRNPRFVRLNPSDPALLGLKQYYIEINSKGLPHVIFESKAQKIIDLLSLLSFQQALIFSNYHSRAASLSEALNDAGWPSACISGNMLQEKRTDAINQLKEFKCRVLISTDLTSRGIDAHNVDLVINMDIPLDWETYMHRIGRAGRFGSHGVAITLSTAEERTNLFDILSKCNTIAVPFPDCYKTQISCESNELEQNTVNNESSSNGHSTVSILSKNDSNLGIQETVATNGEINAPLNANTPEKEPIFNGLSNDAENGSCDLVKVVSINLDHVAKNGKPKKINQLPDDDTSVKHQPQKTTQYTKQTTNDHGNGCNKTIPLPIIPSLSEVIDIDKKQNIHYLSMNFKELKADFEYYFETGEFLDPISPKNEDKVENSSHSDHRVCNGTPPSVEIIYNEEKSTEIEPNKFRGRPIIAKSQFRQIISEISQENNLFLTTKAPQNSVNEFPFKTDQSQDVVGSGDHSCSQSASPPHKNTEKLSNLRRNETKISGNPENISSMSPTNDPPKRGEIPYRRPQGTQKSLSTTRWPISDDSDSSISTSSSSLDITSSSVVTSSEDDSDVTIDDETSWPSYLSSYYQNHFEAADQYATFRRWRDFQILENERIYSENLRRWVAQYAHFITQ